MDGFKVFLLSIVLVTLFFSLENESHAAERISGANRFATAVNISMTGWPNGAKTVVLATGNDYPDALAGGPLAFKYDAPILLTSPNTLSDETKNEIVRLGAKNVIILGGTGAVSEAVVNKLKSLGLEVERIRGKDRYETAAKIAERLPSSSAIVASGQSYPDALSISSYAAIHQVPILLTKKDSLPSSTVALLKDKNNVKVVGGSGVVSDKILSSLPNSMRLSGKDRYLTNSAIVSNLDGWSDKAFVASGNGFADALTGSVLAAKKKAPILLVTVNKVPAGTIPLLDKFAEFSILGGSGVISWALYDFIISHEKENVPEPEPTPEPTPDPETYTFLEINKPYVSSDNEMTVTMNSIDVYEYEGYFEYNITYTEENKTIKKVIEQGSFKIFYKDSGSEPQFGFFNKLYPGESTTRSYTFKALKSKEPLLIEYGADLFFNDKPSSGTLKWEIEPTPEPEPEPEKGTIIEGNINEDTTWTADNSPYMIVDELQIFDNVKLTIQEGTEIKINDKVKIKVAGELEANGTKENPVIFTSQDNKWGGIEFINSNSIISNVLLENSIAAIELSGDSKVLIDGNVFNNNLQVVTDMYGYQEMTFTNNTVQNNNNVFSGIRPLGKSSFKRNSFINNGNVFEYGYYFGEVMINENNFINNSFVIEAPAEGYGKVDISNNWWGTTDTKIIDNLIRDKNKDVSLQLLDYFPLKTQDIENIGSSINY